jgi:hypothetical protein
MTSPETCRNCAELLESDFLRCPACGGAVAPRSATLSTAGHAGGRPHPPEEPAPARQAHILIEEASDSVRSFVLSAKTAVGRAQVGNDIIVRDPGVSRHHGEVRREAAGYVYYDLRSTNGSWIVSASGRHRVETRVPLRDGDQLSIGNVRLTYVEGPASGDRAPQAMMA